MRVVVIGSETWKDIDSVWRELFPLWEEHGAKLVVGYPSDTSGVCRMTDALCAQAGIDRVSVPLNKTRGDGEEHRVKLLLRMIKPELVLLFHPFIANSKRTKLARDLAEEQGFVVRVISR